MKRALIVVMLLAALVSAKSIVLTLDAPDTNISGLAWGKPSGHSTPPPVSSIR